MDRNTVQAMLDDGAVGPLVDYFMDEGLDEAAVMVETREALTRLRQPLDDAERGAWTAYREATHDWTALEGDRKHAEWERARRHRLDELERWWDAVYDVREEWRRRHQKAIDPDRVQAMLDDGAVGPLLDHFDDEGADEDAVDVALYEARRKLQEPLIERFERWDRLSRNGAAANFEWTMRCEAARDLAIDQTRWSEAHDAAMDEWRRRHQKAFDRRTVDAMADEGDWYALHDYLMEERGLTEAEADATVNLMCGANFDFYTAEWIATGRYDSAWTGPARRKALRPDLVRSLLEAGDIDQLLDHFDDEGVDEEQASSALHEAVRLLTRPLRDARDRRFEEQEVVLYWAAAEALENAVDLFTGRRLDAMHRWCERRKSLRPDLVRSLLDAGDVGPLADHFTDEGVGHDAARVEMDRAITVLCEPLRAAYVEGLYVSGPLAEWARESGARWHAWHDGYEWMRETMRLVLAALEERDR